MKQVALFGVGRIGQIHGKNLASLAGVKLKAVYDPITENAKAFAGQFQAEYKTEQQIFDDPSIEALVIASPTSTHSELLRQAAAHKKAVFCEKPIDLSLAEAKNCEKIVLAAKIPCMLGFQRRFDPTFRRAKTALEQGLLGKAEILIITSRDPGAPPVEYLKQSGGIFRDMLIHDFDIANWIFDHDRPLALSAFGACLTDPKIASVPDIDSAIVNIQTAQGCLIQINASRRAAYGYDQRFEILGEKAMAQCFNHHPTETVFSDQVAVHHEKPEHFFLQRYKEAYRLEMEHFFSQLQSGRPFDVTIEDGVKAQALAEAATQSWQKGGQKVELE